MSSSDGHAKKKGRISARTLLTVAGGVAALVGILILLWPGHTAMAVTVLLAAYAIVSGLIYLGLGFFAGEMGGWSRIGHVLLGAVFVIAGIIAFTRLAATTTGLFVFIGTLVGVLWIVEGIASLTSLGTARSRAMTVVFAALSIVAGVVLLLSPLYSVVLWTLLGVSLVVLGVVQIVRAATWKRAGTKAGATS